MAYCSKCGSELKENAKFCGSCGNEVKKNSGDTKKSNNVARVKPISKKAPKNHNTIFLILIMLSVYLVLDFVALQQLEMDTSLDSLVNTAMNTNANAGLTSASVQTTISLENPTPIPVFLTAFSYDISYGTQPVVDGRTGLIFIMPYSTSTVEANAEVSYLNAASTVLGSVVDFLGGNQKTYSTNLYAEMGPLKIPVR